ncbi:98e0a602-269c-4be5-88f3-703435dd16b2-CDS [Sclerotinia trifoliorum]|uniref:98e0a602-269c-4be5-88f3-703435dd16b2-CDS n=1 Tax=Sclerotinia trifoliorum TaxID=28548 RepID=A0A8H2VMT9_9HELO|nr:98e0a602-269c-4be5-88f3-703435dd16b2-CDS [Sclerotinia trifoliorum]
MNFAQHAISSQSSSTPTTAPASMPLRHFRRNMLASRIHTRAPKEKTFLVKIFVVLPERAYFTIPVAPILALFCVRQSFARNIKTRKTFAVKLEMMNTGGDLRQEWELQCHLDHPSIVRVLMTNGISKKPLLRYFKDILLGLQYLVGTSSELEMIYPQNEDYRCC